MEDGIHHVHAPQDEIQESTVQVNDAFGHQLLMEDLLLKARCEVLLHYSQVVCL